MSSRSELHRLEIAFYGSALIHHSTNQKNCKKCIEGERRMAPSRKQIKAIQREQEELNLRMKLKETEALASISEEVLKARRIFPDFSIRAKERRILNHYLYAIKTKEDIVSLNVQVMRKYLISRGLIPE